MAVVGAVLAVVLPKVFSSPSKLARVRARVPRSRSTRSG